MQEFNQPLPFAIDDAPALNLRLPAPDDPEVAALLRAMERAVMRRRGMKCARLFRVDRQFFAGLQQEGLALANEKMTVALRDKTHMSNWTGHYGITAQTRVGKLAKRGKIDIASFPHFQHFMRAFPNIIEMKINGLAEKSGIMHHEEPLIHFHPEEKKYYIQARFHLPLQTNSHAEMLLGGEAFHFATGEIYFFNKGVVHAARNPGNDVRFHLAWDALLTPENYAMMFDAGAPTADFLQRVPLIERAVERKRRYVVGKYNVNGRDLELLGRHSFWRRFSHWHIPAHWTQNLFVAWQGRKPLPVVLAKPDWPDGRAHDKTRHERELRAVVKKRVAEVPELQHFKV